MPKALIDTFLNSRRLSRGVPQGVQPEGVHGRDPGKEFSRGGKQRSVSGAFQGRTKQLLVAVDSSADDNQKHHVMILDACVPALYSRGD